MKQMRLGELIAALEILPDQEGQVVFDFEYAYPTTFEDYRGVYRHLALGFDLGGYNVKQDKNGRAPTVAQLLERAQEAVGQWYSGWHGGEFLMDDFTPLWVSNPGNDGHTALAGVLDRGYEVVLLTSYYEYRGEDKDLNDQ
jgi:hypothetical protein